MSVSVFVDDRLTRRPWLEDRRCDPWLEDEPAAQIDATDLVILVVEGYITLAEAAIDWSVRLFMQVCEVTYKVRGADSTALSKERVRVDRWRKVLLNMVGMAECFLEVVWFG